MLTLTQVSAYIVPSIVLLCFIIGYFIRNFIKTDKINKYIPMIVTICGILAAIFMAVTTGAPITIEIIVGGAVSGLASTGVNEFYHQLVDGGVARNDSDTVKEAVEAVKVAQATAEGKTAEGKTAEGKTVAESKSAQTEDEDNAIETKAAAKKVNAAKVKTVSSTEPEDCKCECHSK